MIFRWLICFSGFLGFLPAAMVGGKVTLQDSQLPAVKKGADFGGVVVSFVPVNNSAPSNLSPLNSPPSKHAVMLQKNKTFLPHILAVQAGTLIDFPNDDPIFHNAFSNYSGQTFDVGLYPPGTKRTVKFSRPGVVRVFCNIHAAMSAVIVVLGTPYFATTGKDGAWSVELPPGEYEMHVFHERAQPATLQALTRHISIGSQPQTLPTIAVSEAGYLPQQHLNKFGKTYPEGSGDDKNYYPGARK